MYMYMYMYMQCTLHVHVSNIIFFLNKVSIQRNEMQQVYLDSENKLREKDEELIALRDIIKVHYKLHVHV